MTEAATRRGRAGNKRRSQKGIEQMPFKVLKNQDTPLDPMSEENVAKMDDAIMRILEEIGIEFLNEEALGVLAESRGVKVTGENVRFERDFVREMLAHVPSSFVTVPRNPERAVIIGDGHMAFMNVSSPPNSLNLDRGRKVGDFETYRDFLKLTQYFNCMHIVGGYPVEPVDIHASVRHLDCLYEKLVLTDKVVHAYSLGPERVEDVIEMARIASGLEHEEFFSKPRLYTNINSSSPLKHDWPMLDGSMRFARYGQPIVVTPFTLAGAMAPVTMPGAVAQSLAEAFAAIVLYQIINPGVPCVVGTFTSNVDMKSGAPAFGTPEYIRATQMTGQMARYYGIPLRASNANASNAADPQAIWESMNSLWAASQAHVNMVYHAAGWLEGGLIASYEKFVMDCEVLQQFQRYHDPLLTEISDDTLALDAIREVGPNGHFFGAAHTQERYSDAFYSPFLSDWRNYEAWEAAGAVETAWRANKMWKEILANFEPPPIDEGIKEALGEFVERRKREGGAPTDF